MYGKDSYFSGSMLVFRYFYGVFMPGLRSRGNGGSSPILDKSESFVSVVILKVFRGMFGGLKGFVYFWGEIENTKPIGSIPMGFVF